MGLETFHKCVQAYERFLRFDEIQTSSDLIKGRAVYLIGLAFGLIQIPNLMFMSMTYGRWTADHWISIGAVALIFLGTQALRYHKQYSTYAFLYSMLIIVGIAASAIPDNTGINSSLLLILIAGILLNGFISDWRWVLIYSGMSLLFIVLLYMNTLGSAGFSEADWAVRTQQRAIQAGLAVILVSVIVCLFTVNLHRLFATLEEKVEETRRAEAAKSHFLANMSHELRTPLNGVIGMTQLLLRTNLDANQRQYAEIVNGCSKGLVAIINDVLDISKLDAGKVVLQHEGFDLKQMLDDLIDMHRPSALAKSLVLDLDWDEAAPRRYYTDESRLRQIMNNLVGNAVKFTDRGHVNVRVSVRAVDTSRMMVSFMVRDTGIGIPPEFQSRVFERFEQVDNTSTSMFQGTGLGLAICRDLVRVFGGELRLASEQGRGTTFAFAIPMQIDRRSPSRRREEEPRRLRKAS